MTPSPQDGYDALARLTNVAKVLRDFLPEDVVEHATFRLVDALRNAGWHLVSDVEVTRTVEGRAVFEDQRITTLHGWIDEKEITTRGRLSLGLIERYGADDPAIQRCDAEVGDDYLRLLGSQLRGIPRRPERKGQQREATT